MLGWVVKQAGCHLDWFRFIVLLTRTNLFWKLSFSDSPINGVDLCSEIEDIAEYQKILSTVLSVSSFHYSSFSQSSRRVGWASARWPVACLSVLSGSTTFWQPPIYHDITGPSLLLKKPPRLQPGLATGLQPFIWTSKQADTFTRQSSMHVRCSQLFRSVRTSYSAPSQLVSKPFVLNCS